MTILPRNIKAGILFGGFGGVEIGMSPGTAGVEPIWSIEKDAAIAAVAQANFNHQIIVADILDVDPDRLPCVDLLHASPPCPSFSQANSKRGETEEDLALARQVVRYIQILQPRWFTLENVLLYRKSKSFQIILAALAQDGYMVDIAHVNAADFGVPQTRRRLLVRAAQGRLLPSLPPPEPWTGWYQAIEDLIPELPESQFAGWQMAKMPDELKSAIFANGSYEDLVIRKKDDNQTGIRACLIASQNSSNSPLTTRYDESPAFTVVANCFEKNSPPKAFIVGGQYQTPNYCEKREVQNRLAGEPIWTVTASEHGDTRVWGNGRIVAMTPRALACFQSFPDWYKLPEDKNLACRGIGNAVPPLMYEKVAQGLIKCY